MKLLKQDDMLLILVAVITAVIFSLLVSRFFISSGNHDLQAQVVQPISPDFKKPDERVFNKDAINPTQLIQIGNDKNPKPF